MLFGIGVDMLQQSRITRTWQRFGQRFVDRLLMPAERAQFARTQRPERFLAMRFAAKEALVKALGTGFAHGMWIRDVGVEQNAWGRPEVIFSPRGERVRRRLGAGAGHVTLSDEAGLIVAVAVLMKAPRRRPTAARGQSSRPARLAAAAKRTAAGRATKPARRGRRS